MSCPECNRVFSIKSNLTRHLRMVHSVEVERIDILPGDFETYHYKCLDGCNISFKYNRELRKHLRVKHGINVVELNLEFPNSEEFSKWLHNEESNNYVQYVHLTATKRKATGVETDYYECSRTGKRIHVDDTVRKRRPRKLITKLNRGCTSQIIVNKLHDGSVSVHYCKTHYGHEMGMEHVRLSKQDRGSVASKLLLGLPVSTVLHSAKSTSGVRRINLLGRKDIVNIRKSFNIDVKDGKVVSAGIADMNLFLAECGNQEFNPVLYCNVQEFPQPDDICFVIMTKYQAEMLKNGNVIVINSTTLKNCDFELITLFAFRQDCEGFPGACMFTNKISFENYQLFFNSIKEKMGVVTPQVIFTHCDEMFYDAWKSIMGEVEYSFYAPAQIDIDWKLNLNLIVCAETEVTRIKRKWVYDTMKSLQSNKDTSDFTDNFEATMKVLINDEDFNDFLQYFLKNFSDTKKWADCYRSNLKLPLKQLEVVNQVLKQYLNEDVEIRFDKIFHSLIRFIRDETINSLLNTKTKGFFVNENDHRHRFLSEKNFNSTHLRETLWNVMEDQSDNAYIVQKFLDRKCCSLVCSCCNICLHCFSCSCVDFFVGNVICVHIHYVWVTYFQSIAQDEEEGDREPACDEEIIIEIDQEQEVVTDNVEDLRTAILEKAEILCENVGKIESESALKVILETLNQLCDISTVGEEVSSSEDGGEKVLEDHSYL